jgi:hypothetical protein
MTDKTPEQPTAGMWAPAPEIGEPLETLEEAGQFVLVAIDVRPSVKTEFGDREPVDLTVATTDPVDRRHFSGFSAGVVAQAKRLADGDLPAVCRIVSQPTRKGQTKGLELVRLVNADADLAAIAKALPVPMMPIPDAAKEAVGF